MRIALDGIPLHQPLTGVGHYTLELARALAISSPADDFEIVSPLSFLPLKEKNKNGWPPNLQLVQASTNVISRRWWTLGLPRHIQKRPFDLFHGTNYEVPLWRKCPTVLTVHDLSLLLHPETHEKRRVWRARHRLPLMVRGATIIVTPSESVRRELCQRLQVSPAKVVAIPEAPRRVFRHVSERETSQTRTRLGIADEFLLFVGTIEPRKNLTALVQAFTEVSKAGNSNLQLVLAGNKGWLTNDLFDLISRSMVADRIKLTGYLDDEELRALYSSCRAFVYPSLYEGFGLPPLEAMACGAPVITSRTPSIVEVVNQAAQLVDPEDVQGLARSIVQLLRDEAARQKLSAAGLRRAAEFSWERTARLTREVYREAIARFGK